MSKSLQDQLLRAGLANKKQAVKAKKAKNNKERLKRAGKAVDDEVTDAVKKAEQEKLDKDRELNDRKNRQAAENAIRAQVAQLIEMNSIKERGDIEFSFPDDKLIKTIHVSEKQQNALAAGAVAIVKSGEQYHIVPRKACDKIAERDEAAVLLCNADTGDQQFDDEYADYQVPDDLMW